MEQAFSKATRKGYLYHYFLQKNSKKAFMA